eukprot:CAMPEP_0183318832 /NCGR_PEP_ID=MMETSP0160_2-20130417/61804_1 /TAXON_ID=2839 ORGANISM="Odontella Sinensis, Strain Grunow 1884" /NCGR_SAMPLE_ID=MMETSP0160_2 /ASSEMBLY_ACC=CAM_ASM_000250 /LENGTH=75 /DNA_ID=CAMNT_0025485183 /DNA_START=99 /DNA_END=323 /DNA_ORIENTATION=+
MRISSLAIVALLIGNATSFQPWAHRVNNPAFITNAISKKEGVATSTRLDVSTSGVDSAVSSDTGDYRELGLENPP